MLMMNLSFGYMLLSLSSTLLLPLPLAPLNLENENMLSFVSTVYLRQTNVEGSLDLEWRGQQRGRSEGIEHQWEV